MKMKVKSGDSNTTKLKKHQLTLEKEKIRDLLVVVELVVLLLAMMTRSIIMNNYIAVSSSRLQNLQTNLNSDWTEKANVIRK